MSRKRKSSGRAPGRPIEQTELASMSHADLWAGVKEVGGQRAFSRKHKIPRTTLQAYLYKERTVEAGTASEAKVVEVAAPDQTPPVEFGERPAPVPVRVGQGSGIRRFILSSAQDQTRVHGRFLATLETYAAWLRQSGTCEIMIGGYTYSKKLFTEHDPGQSWFHELVQPYLVTDRIRIAGKVDFCAEMNTRPTAEDPLSGLHTYTRERWGVFPHAKVALRSVPTMKHDPAKIIMTTGSVTKPNYLPMKAGVKASFHHVYGAVLVEVDADGTFFCRHLIGDETTGAFYDLDRHVSDSGVVTGSRVRAVTPGDLHVFQIDPTCSRALFGFWPTDQRTRDGRRVWERTSAGESLIDFLRPEHLFAHDILDFRVRNHHNLNDPHDRFLLHIQGTESVEAEVAEVALFLDKLGRNPPCEFGEASRDMAVHIVDSNHDQALLKWLKTGDYKTDPVNAVFFLRCQLALYEAMQQGVKDFSVFETVVRERLARIASISQPRFLKEDDSFRLDGVEHSCHGHRGLNGARGTTASYAKIGPKVSKGHGHSAMIIDGVYEAGTTSLLDMGYNSGPSSWSHSTIVQYLDGKRALITLCNGRTHL